MTTYGEGCHGEEKGRVPVIGFDMGGTSTDVSRYAGEYEHVFESTTAGITIQAPQASTVSICHIDHQHTCSWTSTQWLQEVAQCCSSGQACL